jgi:hypothetical protein
VLSPAANCSAGRSITHDRPGTLSAGNQWSRRSGTGGREPVGLPAFASARCRAPVVAGLTLEAAQPASASQATRTRNAIQNAALPGDPASRSSGRPTEHDNGDVTAPVAALRRGGKRAGSLRTQSPI